MQRPEPDHPAFKASASHGAARAGAAWRWGLPALAVAALAWWQWPAAKAWANASAGASAPASPGAAGPAGAGAAQAAALPEVRTALARPAAPGALLRLPARTEPQEEARLYARTSGVLVERLAELGDMVAAGAVLARVAAPEVDQALASAQASLAQAQARERLAEQTLQRNRPLVEQSFISPTRLDDLAAALDVARADSAAAAAELRRLQALQGFQTVRAPFAGVIVERGVERGDRVSADGGNNSPALFRLARVDTLRVVVDLPQSAVAVIQRGSTARLVFPEFGAEVFTAQVERMAGRIDPASGAMRVELSLPNPGRRIPAGMRGEVELDLAAPGGEATAAAVAVPANALQTLAGQVHVVALDAEDRLRFLPVQVRRSVGRDVEISAGLDAGTRVVLNANALLQEGQRVRVAPTRAL